jgi:hypothetical protein
VSELGRTVPRAKAFLITSSSNKKEIRYPEATAMLWHGQAERISERPLVIRICEFPTYDEELRYLSGRRINASPTTRELQRQYEHLKQNPKMDGDNDERQAAWDGRMGAPSKGRFRPPRCALYPPEEEREFRRNKRLHFNQEDDRHWEAVKGSV